MSIKIDGKNNRISKTSGTNVEVYDKLFLGNNEITGENTGGGGGGAPEKTYYYITKNGDYSYDNIPSDVTHVKIDVTNYDGASDPFITGYKRVTANTTLQRSSLTGDGLSVRIPDPNQTVEGISDQVYRMSPRDFASSKQSEKKQLAVGIDYSLYDVKVKSTTIIGEMKWAENMESSSPWAKFELACAGNVPFTSTAGADLINPAMLSATFDIQYIDEAWYLVCNYELSRQPGDTRTWYCNTDAYTITLSFTPKVTATAMSVNPTEASANTSNTINNLIINNDALITGNLTVLGSINDLKWYWEEKSISQENHSIGKGFLAKFTNFVIVTDSNSYTLPQIQLSPGASYKTDDYSILWTADGNLKIENCNVLQYSALINILRYE